MFKSILVPIDVMHKSSWQKAIPEAIAMTKAARGKLVVMTVVRETTAMLGAVRTRLQLQSMLDEARGHLSDDRAEIFRGRAKDRGGSSIWQYRSRDSGDGKGSESRSDHHGVTPARDARLSHWPECRACRVACAVFGPCSAPESVTVAQPTTSLFGTFRISRDVRWGSLMCTKADVRHRLPTWPRCARRLQREQQPRGVF